MVSCDELSLSNVGIKMLTLDLLERTDGREVRSLSRKDNRESKSPSHLKVVDRTI